MVSIISNLESTSSYTIFLLLFFFFFVISQKAGVFSYFRSGLSMPRGETIQADFLSVRRKKGYFFYNHTLLKFEISCVASHCRFVARPRLGTDLSFLFIVRFFRVTETVRRYLVTERHLVRVEPPNNVVRSIRSTNDISAVTLESLRWNNFYILLVKECFLMISTFTFRLVRLLRVFRLRFSIATAKRNDSISKPPKWKVSRKKNQKKKNIKNSEIL